MAYPFLSMAQRGRAICGFMFAFDKERSFFAPLSKLLSYYTGYFPGFQVFIPFLRLHFWCVCAFQRLSKEFLPPPSLFSRVLPRVRLLHRAEV
ncbi:MAG: hypothetical protein LUG64_04880 [Clostridiales bacterium]|nr:hypothetical protein [Clostridiales bacterium]